MIALGLVLQSCPPLRSTAATRCSTSPRRRSRRCRSAPAGALAASLFRSGRWSLGFFGGIARVGALRHRARGSRRSRSCRPRRPAASACWRSAAGGFARPSASASAPRSPGSLLLGLSLGSHPASSRGYCDRDRRLDRSRRVAVAAVVARALPGRRGSRHGLRCPLCRGRRGDEGRRRRRLAASVHPGAARLPRAGVRLHAAGVPARRPPLHRRARRPLDERPADRSPAPCSSARPSRKAGVARRAWPRSASSSWGPWRSAGASRRSWRLRRPERAFSPLCGRR